MGDFELLYKLLVIGNSGVGKTSLLTRYVTDQFSTSLLNTVGVDFKTKVVTCLKRKIKLQIWDTAGHERFKTITGSFYRGAMGILLVYDITDASTFAETRTWLDNIKEKCAPDDDPIIILVGNKCDLTEKRQVETENGKSVADTYGILHSETSAADNTNVSKTFEVLVEAITKRDMHMSLSLPSSGDAGETHTLQRDATPMTPAGGCCRK